MKAALVIASLLVAAGCSDTVDGQTTGAGGSDATGTGGSDATGAGGSSGASCTGDDQQLPPPAGLHGCATASSCREQFLHSEIQWGHSSTVDVLECMGALVEQGGPGVLRWRSDVEATVAVMRGDGFAWKQVLSFTYGDAPPAGCWEAGPVERCSVGPAICADAACEAPTWSPDALTDCVLAEPVPACDDVAALAE